MRKRLIIIAFITSFVMLLTPATALASGSTGTAGQTPSGCTVSGGGSILSFPHWYEYIGKTDDNGVCTPQIRALSDVWLIVAAVIEILLRVASLLAVGFIIYGGVKFIMSQGEPDETKHARDTIFNSLIGLAISVGAAFLVSFFAGRFNP